MRGARNPAEFEAQINQILRNDLVKSIVEQTLQELRDFVYNEWYLEHEPQEYTRTYQFLDSLVKDEVKRVGRKFVSAAFSNPDEMVAMINDDSMFNWHASFDGTDVTEMMAEFIEEGQNSSVYPYKGIHMFRETNKWLSKNIYRICREVFAKYGIKVIRTK